MPQHTPPAATELTFRQISALLWANRKRIVVLSVSVAILTLGINFLLPRYYKANAVILPETEKNKLGMSSQMAGLASIAGVSIPGSDIARLYPVMLTSESVLRGVIERKYASERFKDSVNLIQYFELDDASPAKNFDQALKVLQSLMTVGIDSKTSVVNVSLEMREPQLAADVLNAALAHLDFLLREKKNTSASEQRKWIEERLVHVESELRDAEERLKDFRERNRRISDSPQLVLQQERLLREVQVKGTIDIELRKQAELAKIEEISR